MRRKIPYPRRKVQWENGAVFARQDLFQIPTIAGSSTYDAQWLRVPAGVFDNANNREVPVDWTLIREIHSAFSAVLMLEAGIFSYIFGMGVIAWDGTSDSFTDVVGTPLPVQQGGLDWIWNWVQPHTLDQQQYDSVFGQNLFGADGMVFTKSQRKISAGTGLLFVAEMYATDDGMNGTWGYSYNGRYAYKLP